MKNNYLKILTVLFCMVALVVTFALPCFADPVGTDQTLRVTVDYNESGGYFGGFVIDPDADIHVKVTQNNAVVFDANAFKVVLGEESGGFSVKIYASFDEYSDDLPSVNYNNVTDLGRAVFEFTGIAFFIPPSDPYESLTYEVIDGENPVVGGITGVFSNISGFVVSSLVMLQGVFYDGTNLTMLGTLALIGVAIATAFLIVGVIQSFLRLRG